MFLSADSRLISTRTVKLSHRWAETVQLRNGVRDARPEPQSILSNTTWHNVDRWCLRYFRLWYENIVKCKTIREMRLPTSSISVDTLDSVKMIVTVRAWFRRIAVISASYHFGHKQYNKYSAVILQNKFTVSGAAPSLQRSMHCEIP